VAWVHDPYVSPLRFAYGSADAKTSTERLISDALHMANQAGLLARARPRSTILSGTVKVLVDTRAVVRLDRGDLVSVHAELTCPGVPLERVLTVEMPVSGSFDEQSKRLDIREALRSADECLSTYQLGQVVLARVQRVTASAAQLQLHPESAVSVTVADVSSNPLDRLTDLMSDGEVVVARLVAVTPEPRVSLLDIDDEDAPAEAPSLLPGGPPWLVPADLLSTTEEPDEPVQQTAPSRSEATTEAPEPGSITTSSRAEPPAVVRAPSPADLAGRRSAAGAATPQVRGKAIRDLARSLESSRAAEQRARRQEEEARQRAEALEQELMMVTARAQNLQDQLTSARNKLERQRAQLRLARRQPRRAARPRRPEEQAQRYFLDPEEQFLFEVHQSWVRRIPASEKHDRPLGDPRIGPHFLATLDRIEGVDRAKVVDVVVEILTNLVHELNGREVHQLREGSMGNAPAVTRDDGATCWRVALQVNSPAARRLHFWRLPDSSIELSRVVTHDDMNP